MSKIILDLCGGTGSWSKPYKEAGYDVRVVTLPEYDVMTYQPPRDVYGVLAAPPCTEFSCAKADKPRDLKTAMEIVKACLQIIWQCRIENKLSFWALENPRGLLRQFLGAPAFTFEHWQYGEEVVKPTDIWGWFKQPRYTVKNKPDNLTKRFPNGQLNSKSWANPKAPPEYAHMGLGRAAIRAITPPGFARAFYEANQ